METQLKGGQKPEHIVLTDFAFPDSSGFPTREFVELVYNGCPCKQGMVCVDRRIHFESLFPGLEEVFDTLRKEAKDKQKEYIESFKVQKGYSFEEVIIEYSPPPREPTMRYILPEALKEVGKPSPSFSSPNKRSKIVDLDDKESKFLPNLHQCVLKQLDLYEGVMWVGEVYHRFGCTPNHLMKAAEKGGFNVSSFDDDGIVSRIPVQVPGHTPQLEIFNTISYNKDIISADMANQKEFMKQNTIVQEKGDGPMVVTKPEKGMFVQAFIDDLRYVNTVGGGLSLLQEVTTFLSRQDRKYQTSWESRVLSQQPSQVESIMFVQCENKERFIVSQVSAISFKIARDYQMRELARRINISLVKRGKCQEENVPFVLTENPYNPKSIEQPVLDKELAEKPASWVEEVEAIPPPLHFRDSIEDRIKDEEYFQMLTAIDCVVAPYGLYVEQLTPIDLLQMYTHLLFLIHHRDTEKECDVIESCLKKFFEVRILKGRVYGEIEKPFVMPDVTKPPPPISKGTEKKVRNQGSDKKPSKNRDRKKMTPEQRAAENRRVHENKKKKRQRTRDLGKLVMGVPVA